VPGRGDYNSETGVFTIPTDTDQLINSAGYIDINEARNALTSGTGISYDRTNGSISVNLVGGTGVTIVGDNISIGQNTLKSSNGSGGVAIGSKALELTSGSTNTAVGFNAGLLVTNGASNTFLGSLAGSAVTSGSKNVIIGANTGSSIATSSNNIIISDGDGNSRISVDSSGVVSIPGSVSVTGAVINHLTQNVPTLDAGNSYRYTLVLLDDGKLIEMNTSDGQGNTLEIPLNATVAFPVGTQIVVIQTGAGQTTVTGVLGVTVNATPGPKLRATWSSATLIKRSTNTWVLVGDLTV
jgi:hypothetical protein